MVLVDSAERLCYTKRMTQPRIGFCCKWLHPHDVVGNMQVNASDRDLNGRTTTVTWLNRQTRANAEDRLWEIMEHNIRSVSLMLETVINMPPMQRMFRIGSELLPAYTEPRWNPFWQRPDVVSYCEREFAKIGVRAREQDVRLSFHPGQFVCLASDNPDIVRRSAEEFEYHATMARWMGYGQQWHDHGFKINVHMSGRLGAEGFRNSLSLLSPEARNLITVENDEMGHGLDDVLAVSDQCPVVLDIHHHWVRTGQYIRPDDARVRQVVDSWRGVRPAMHYSVSREDILVNHCADTLPDLNALAVQGHKKQKLRAHSDYYWNNAANQWALSFLPNFDIQCESKAKNLASTQLAKLVTSSCS